MTVKDFIKKLNPNDVLEGYIAFRLYTREWGKKYYFYCDQKESKEYYGKEWSSVDEWLDHRDWTYNAIHSEIDIDEPIQCFINDESKTLTYEIYYIENQNKES